MYFVPLKLRSVTLKLVRFDTIYALATPPVKSALAVIRSSGPSAANIIKHMTNLTENRKQLTPRYAYLARLFRPGDPCNILDQALMLYFEAPNSFTGEDVVEIQCHGGLAIVAEILKCLSELEDFRPALPGEFSKRAFLNGKLNLSQANSLNNLINSETSRQKDSALRNYLKYCPKSRLSENNLFVELRAKLTESQAFLEAVLNFSEDDDLDSASILTSAKGMIERVVSEIKIALDRLKVETVLQKGIKLAIIGPPNVGKSSLMNVLSKADKSIVSPFEGTTRDVIESVVDFRGWPVRLIDTAGLRTSSDQIEQLGMERTRKVALEADVVVCLTSIDMIGEDYYQFFTTQVSKNTPSITVVNKSDLLGGIPNDFSNDTAVYISCKYHQGLNRFYDELNNLLTDCFSTSNEVFTNSCSVMQEDVLKRCLKELQMALNEDDEVMMAEYVNDAITVLSSCIGNNVLNDEILDNVFKTFCIGK